jgi:hypothetical protein
MSIGSVARYHPTTVPTADVNFALPKILDVAVLTGAPFDDKRLINRF